MISDHELRIKGKNHETFQYLCFCSMTNRQTDQLNCTLEAFWYYEKIQSCILNSSQENHISGLTRMDRQTVQR